MGVTDDKMYRSITCLFLQVYFYTRNLPPMSQSTAPKSETFAVYQRESRKTWSVIHTDHSIVYPTLGLTNEAGEVAGKIKKIFRDRNGEISDVLWYLTQICTELGLTLEEVAEANLTKLFSRQARGVISGDGDVR